jgi:secreted trypsin-like serine protease
MPSGSQEKGVCTLVRDCPSLNKLFEKETLTSDEVNLLARSRCGRSGLVCCLTVNDKSSLLPDDSYCPAATEDRILGGEKAGLREFPWLTLLNMKRLRNGAGKPILNCFIIIGLKSIHILEFFGCGGSLISSRYVLTAAHCIDDTKWTM